MSKGVDKEQARQLSKVTALTLTDLLVDLGLAQAALGEKGIGATKVETLATVALDKLEQNDRRHHTDPFVRMPDPDARREWFEQQDGSTEEAREMFGQIIGTIIELRDGAEEED